MTLSKWTLDSNHSEIIFKVKHLMIATVTGYFLKFSVDAEADDEDFSKFQKIVFLADANSISTNNEQRDKHLKSADFFDVINYPAIVFTATEFKNGVNGELVGQLTMKGITKPVSIEVEFGGFTVDAYGQRKAGFSFHGKLSRKEFGLTWDSVTEAGNVVVSDEVKFQGEIELIKTVVETSTIKEKETVHL
ncbi:MAG: YceI family protein [Ginsengibacter sp.]